MTSPRNAALMRICSALIVGLVCFATHAVADTLTWNGNNSNGWTAAVWKNPSGTTVSPSFSSGPGDDLVFTSTANLSFMTTTLINNSANSTTNFNLRSISISNAGGFFNNATTNLRIAPTSSASSSSVANLIFSTGGIDIITLSNNTIASFNATTSTGTGTPSQTLNLNYNGYGTIRIDGTSQLSATVNNVSITGTGGIIKEGAGTIRLAETHTFAGGFELKTGNVELISSGIVTNNTITSSPYGTGSITLSGGNLYSSSATNRTVYNAINLNGTASVTSNVGNFTGNMNISTAAGQGTILLQNSTLNIAQGVFWNQAISGNYSLTKTGSGTLILNSPDNSYAGGTTVSQGTLRVNGYLPGNVVVASGAALSGGASINNLVTGNATINGNAIISGSHNPGSSAAFGIQTINGNVTYNSGATIGWDLGSNTSTQNVDPTAALFDQVVVGNSVNFAGATALSLAFNASGSTVLWTDAFWAANQSWKIYDAASVTGFSSLTLTTANWLDTGANFFNSSRPGSSFTLSELGGDIFLNYNVAPVPEPATYAALLGLAGLSYALYRRRQRS